jgi:epimerase transport system membrane fusion protein
MEIALAPPFAALHDPRREAARLVRTGCWILVGAVLPIVLWMALAPLAMAVVAPGVVKVDLNRRPVQHLEGGTVREVLVRDGQHVKAGEPVLVLGDVRVDADRNRLDYRMLVERAALVRLDVEQRLAPELRFPADLLQAAKGDARIQEALAKEAALFDAQRHSLDSSTALMRTQRERVQQEMAAIKAQIEQAQQSLELQRQDLENNRGLLREGFISPSRISQMEATVIDYASRMEERRSELARADQRLAEIELKIQSTRNDYVKAASDQLKLAVQRRSEVEQEQRKSEDASRRQVVVAPATGVVIDLKFTSPGAVVAAGETIADVVPTGTPLLVEARVRPEDIASVSLGQRSRVKFTAFKYRNSMMVSGKVTYVAADRLVDRQTGAPYYTALVLADPESIASVGDLKLQAGMPAEVYIEGTRQTALQYLIEPITTTLRRAGRQM